MDQLISAINELKSIANTLRERLDGFIQNHTKLHETLNSKISSIESRLSSVESKGISPELSTLPEMVRSIKQEISQLSAKIAALEAKLATLEQKTTAPMPPAPQPAVTQPTPQPSPAPPAPSQPAVTQPTPQPSPAPPAPSQPAKPSTPPAPRESEKIVQLPPNVLPETVAEPIESSRLGFDRLIQLVKSHAPIMEIANELIRMRDELQQQYRSTAFFEMNRIAQHLKIAGEGRLDPDSERRLLKKIGEWELRILKKWHV